MGPIARKRRFMVESSGKAQYILEILNVVSLAFVLSGK